MMAKCFCIRRHDKSELQELYLDFHNENQDEAPVTTTMQVPSIHENTTGKEDTHKDSQCASSTSAAADRNSQDEHATKSEAKIRTSQKDYPTNGSSTTMQDVRPRSDDVHKVYSSSVHLHKVPSTVGYIHKLPSSSVHVHKAEPECPFPPSPQQPCKQAANKKLSNLLSDVRPLATQPRDTSHTQRSVVRCSASTGHTDGVRTILEDGGSRVSYSRQASHPGCVRRIEPPLQTRSLDDLDPIPSRSRNPFEFFIHLFRPKRQKPQEDFIDPDLAPDSTIFDADSSHLPAVLLNSPVKQQKETEVLESIEKIQVSREDNPVLAKIKQSHSRLSSLSDEEAVENYIPNYIVRSPPPIIKHHHLSREVKAASYGDRDAQTEILALQRVNSHREDIIIV